MLSRFDAGVTAFFLSGSLAPARIPGEPSGETSVSKCFTNRGGPALPSGKRDDQEVWCEGGDSNPYTIAGVRT